MTDEPVFKMAFSRVYPLLVQKAECRERTQSEVDAIIFCLTEYDNTILQTQIERSVNLEIFFAEAPQISPDATKISGVICGHRVVEINHPLMQKIRWLDKPVDELAKGKPLDKVLRS